ncbi:MAG: SGNH/GDSL hydrolase family protein [Acidimicrobiales bacterium]|nr:SGNH/GDSL hydrolase family protein [Acidimicrobiales bacterium]HRW37914.1 SGNH/GDSL hydrolase family protein [Aquihabitans sp.]
MKVHRIRRLSIGAVALAAVVGIGLTSCEPAPDTYVALGDSYTAGPLILNQSLEPLGCLRSDRNYPRIAKPQIKAAKFVDVSCSGATTSDFFEEQGVTPGPNPPQFNALNANTKVVTIGIGGNDIGFSSIVKNCATLDPFSSGCKGDYVVNGVDALAKKIDATAPKIDKVLVETKKRAPNAKIFVVGYPTIIPETGSGCWPVVPIVAGDITYLRGVAKKLNAMLKARAVANGATYVDTATSSIGHDMCSSSKWVEAIVPTTDAAPVHPNASGMRNTGNVVATAINAVVTS